MRSKGFTLVEILVVVVIMAIVISLAVLSIGVTGRDSQLDEESRRIEGLLGLLHERALLEGRDFGLSIEPSAYEFVVYEAALQLDSQTVVLKPVDRNLKSDQVSPSPQVAIAASGEGTPFRLTLERAATNAKSSVEGDALGKISRVSSDHVDKRT